MAFVLSSGKIRNAYRHRVEYYIVNLIINDRNEECSVSPRPYGTF